MRTLDLTPLFRSTVGFDRLNHVFDTLMRDGRDVAYPPYNIEKYGDNNYRITMAVAGFGEHDIDITFQQNLLVVTGKIQEKTSEAKGEFLHKGIANRSFEHKFQLADHIRVEGADINNGLLEINLVREIPEALKPQKIALGKISPKNVIDVKTKKAN